MTDQSDILITIARALAGQGGLDMLGTDALLAKIATLADQNDALQAALDAATQPQEPEPSELKSAAHWLALYRAEWDRQWALPDSKIQRMYYGGAEDMWTYHNSYCVDAHGAAWLADPYDHVWLVEGLRAAEARVDLSVPTQDGRGWWLTAKDGTRAEYNHQEIFWAGSVAWLLWEMQERGLHTDERYAKRWTALRDFAVMLADKWWKRSATHGDVIRRVSHIASHSLRMVAFLRVLEGVTLPWLADAEKTISATLRAHFAKYPDAAYNYWLWGTEYTLEDVSHGQFDVDAALKLNRLNPAYWPDAPAYFYQTFVRALQPNGRFSKFVDGSGGTTWVGYVAVPGWFGLGAELPAVQKALESYTLVGQEYPFPLAIMAENAARLGG